MLADLERHDPKFTFPAAGLLGLYRCLLEPCVSKQIHGQKLEQRIQIVKEAGTHLSKEGDGLQLRHDKQLFRLRFLEQALELFRDRVIRVLEN